MPIVPAAPPDFDAVQTLLSRCGLPHEDLTLSHLDHFLICRDGDPPRGVVGVELYGTVALLRSLAVLPTHRSNGVGARLTQEIEAYARRQGARDLYLLTTTAAEYFRRQGYREVPRDELPKTIRETEQATRLCPSSATSMTKHLDNLARQKS